MSISIDSTNGTLVVTPQGYARSGGLSGGLSIREKVRPSIPAFQQKTSVGTRPETYTSRDNLIDELETKTKNLRKSLAKFEFPSGNNPRDFRTAVVSDPDKASAQAESKATIATYTLNINRLAAPKKIQSTVLVSNDITKLEEGTHTFTLEVGDKTYSLSISVDKSGSDPDTNRDVLNKIANAVSGANSDIEAFVKQAKRKVYSATSDMTRVKVSQLRINATEITEGNGFSIREDDGSIIESLKLDQIAQASQLSKYTLDTVTAETDSNSFSTDNGRLAIELLNSTSSPVTIKVEEGIKPLKKKIEGLIEEYNSYVSWLDKNSQNLDTSIKKDVVEEGEAIKLDLNSIGLTLNDDGTVKVSSRLKTELGSDADTVRTVLTGSDGFFTRVAEKLTTVLSIDAEEYVSDPNQSRRLSLFA